MFKILKYSLVLCLLFSFTVQAQKLTKKQKAEKWVNDYSDKASGRSAPVAPTEEYKTAVALVDSAILKLKAGAVNEADELIRQSIASYPTINVFDYVRELCLMPDISSANTIMDLLYAKVLSLPDQQLMVLDYLAYSISDGVMVKKVRLTDRNRVAFNFATKIAMLRQEFDTFASHLKTMKMALAIDFPIHANATLDPDYLTKQGYEIAVAKLEKDYDKAIRLVEAREESLTFQKVAKNSWLVDIYIQKGDYEAAKKLAESNTGNDFVVNKSLFIVNTLLGNNEAALGYFEKSNKASEISNDFYYYLALVDLNKKEYDKALSDLDLALHHKSQGMWKGYEGAMTNKYEVYKATGDAYAGLKQFEKAKDHYNLSLLYYPEYEPAQKALVQLESVIATTTSTDKSPPKITILEPSVSRGLEVIATANDILVKGVALDPSGLKSVTINGLSVYAQPGGDFWGNINLKDGATKITIRATDGAGNSAEETFTINKKAGGTAVAIVPATVKVGKNYCLLIGAQNYNDLSIPSLENPIQDAVRLKLILKKDYNFDESNILSLFNPSANDVKRQLLELSTSIQSEDNLVIFYAGHGTWVEKEKKGYWLLVDAKRNDPNTWLQNKDVLQLIAKLPSRHTLLITDACFSGGVFKTRSIGKDAPLAIQTMNEKISRVAITSGNDTEVPDESVFMKYLIKALTENKEKYLTAQKMFIDQIMEAVMTETKTEPRYGTLELAGHVGGDYIFAKK